MGIAVVPLELVKIHWPLQEIYACKDLPVATFYALLDDEDRKLLKRYHIDIHGDRRRPLPTRTNDEEIHDR